MKPDRNAGIVLAMVLILALLLSTAIITFTRRAIVDKMIATNRNATAQAEALARGGVQLAMALVLEDVLLDAESDSKTVIGDTLGDGWAKVDSKEFVTDYGSTLHLMIRDTGSRLNLNALVDQTKESENPDQTQAEEFLVTFLGKIIDEIPLPPGDKFYDPRELAQNLIDYVDPNEERTGGRGSEDDYYQSQSPPYRSANRPLLGVEELRMIEGFDAAIVEAMTPYVTVYPLVSDQGININTAPPHVLTAMYHGSSGDRRLASPDAAQRLLRERESGRIICDESSSAPDQCLPVGDFIDGSLYPPVQLPARATTFEIVSVATVDEVTRQLEVVIDRTRPISPRLLRWRYR